MRTTVDIDAPILKELKQLQRREGKSLGRIISELLAVALRQRKAQAAPTSSFRWISRPMGARHDLADREAILDAMDETPRKPGGNPRPS